MHLQPTYHKNAFVTAENLDELERKEEYKEVSEKTTPAKAKKSYDNLSDIKRKEFQNSVSDVGADIFSRGLCLPSDIKMTKEQQNKVIQIVKSCFEG